VRSIQRLPLRQYQIQCTEMVLEAKQVLAAGDTQNRLVQTPRDNSDSAEAGLWTGSAEALSFNTKVSSVIQELQPSQVDAFGRRSGMLARRQDK